MMIFNRLETRCIDLNELAMELPEGRAKDAVLEAERLLHDVNLDIQQAIQDLRLGRKRAPNAHLNNKILQFRQRETAEGTNPPAA